MTGTPSFETVAERLTPPLRRYLARFIDDRTLAEDLLQESLLRIATGLPRLEPSASIDSWCFGVATHVAIDHLRKSQSGARIREIEDVGSIPDGAADVEQPLVIDEMSSCVREEIDSLPGDHRAALILHDLQGLTAAQTAEACGCSLATAKIRIHRARTRLKQALERDCHFYHDDDQVLRCDPKSRERG